MSNEWSRVATTTIRNYLKGFEQQVLRTRMVLAMIEDAGQVTYGEVGDGRQWQVQYRIPPLVGNRGEGTVTFTRQDYFKNAFLDWRGYLLTDAITKRERLKNRGKAALVDVFGGMVKRLSQGIRENFAPELYIDGNATNNEDRIHGIESFMGSNGTINVSTGAQRSANAADPVAYPLDTYADLSTELGAVSGSQTSGVWPRGTATPDFDYFSPLMVNYTSTFFAGASATWAVQCVDATRFGIIHSQRNVGSQGGIDIICLDREMYREYLGKLDSKERAMTDSQSKVRKFGFRDTFLQDGVEIGWEYGVPTGINGTVAGSPQGYGFNTAYMEIFTPQDQLFAPEEMFYNNKTRAWEVLVDFLGNMQCESPRMFLKLGNYA